MNTAVGPNVDAAFQDHSPHSATGLAPQPRHIEPVLYRGVPMSQDPVGATLRVLDFMRSCFWSLQEPYQTRESRKMQHENYRLAIRETRECVTLWRRPNIPIASVFFLALYEMSVNLESNDKTWQIHLDGLLTILQSRPRITNTRAEYEVSSSLIAAVEIFNCSANIWHSLAGFSISDSGKGWLAINLVVLQLRKLVTEFDVLFGRTSSPRKIDMQKLRKSFREVNQNLALLPSIINPRLTELKTIYGPGQGPDMSPEGTPKHPPFLDDCCQEPYSDAICTLIWNEYRTALIITSSVLLRTGAYLHSGSNYKQTKEYRDLSQTIHHAVDSICGSLPAHSPKTTLDQPVAILHGLLFLWPLHCASGAPGIAESQREWIRGILLSIGMQTHIPKALALAIDDGGPILSDILAGMILINAGLLDDREGVTRLPLLAVLR
ncbi:putative Zn(2)-C6 fungal-type domain-containing protein [Seiridium cardinale]|uniref:Zn(2)-C6 fungal-type domain-containing protein n=1 Tax=Seiridium cardinale TaxID=138064 RepID=A0ABR2Y255_9PEZI